MPTVRSTCPFDCPDACGLLVDVEDGRALRVRGDPEHPWSRGTLCSKMNGYERSVHSPDRLRHPLVRTGAKGEGAFRRASWDEAIAIVAGRFREIAAREGTEAILPYSYAGSMGLVQRNAGMPFFHRLGASRLDRTICTPAQGAGWRAVMGDTPGPSPETVVESDLVVLWGVHAVATNVHLVPRVKEARRRGARVLLVETWENETARLADRTYVVRPGSDGALALALVHVLARDGLADERFLAAEAVGWPELRARALADCPPERAAAATGLPAAEIEALAHALAAARAPFLRIGGGPSRHGNGAMNVRSVVALAAVLGAFGRRGGGCLASTGSSQAFDLSPVVREDLLPRPTRIVNMNRLGAALAGELGGPPIRAMYVWGSNPAAVAPDQNAVLRGLAREDLFLAVHERFLTDTARLADVVLPATSSLEHADLYRSYGQYCVQRVRAAIPPLGEARANWDVFGLLARAMGFEEPVFRATADEAIDLLLARPSPWRDAGFAARLAEGRALVLAPPGGPRWRTPSGKIELLNAALAEPLPRHLPAHSDAPGPPLRLVTAPALHTLNSTFMERPELRERNGGMTLRLAPAEARARGLADGERVVAWNERGEVVFVLRVDPRVPPATAVAEGVWWTAHAPGGRNVNALTSQRLTDAAAGSTFYDNRIDVRRE
ncbi:MAG TPA: molybdopterin oxidoreductase family protein [Anaeromyxobacter sp.]|nr:molybdopterin oxidoreductase family protein [Anaeromyxobacter sp.]